MKSFFTALFLGFVAVTSLAQAETAGPFNWNSAYLRQAPSGVAAGYVTLQNPTASDDALIGASAPWAGRIELHEIKQDKNGVMKMSPVEKISLEKNGTALLTQGGYHLMIFDIKGKLNVEERKDIALKFEKAGTVTIPFTVQPISGNPEAFRNKLMMDHGHHGH